MCQQIYIFLKSILSSYSFDKTALNSIDVSKIDLIRVYISINNFVH